MRKALKFVAGILGVLSLIAVVWITLVWHLFSGVHPYVPDPVYSSDGLRVIIPSIDFNKDDFEVYLLVHLEVQDTLSGKTLFQVQTRASDRMRWSVSWVNDHTIKLDSADIGTSCWSESDGKIWKEVKCS